MINPFNRFYDTRIDIYTAEKNSYNKKGERTFVTSITADIQPYTDNTEKKPFGLDENRACKMFCDKNSAVKCGAHVLFGGKWYMISAVSEGYFGMSAVIRSCEYEG